MNLLVGPRTRLSTVYGTHCTTVVRSRTYHYSYFARETTNYAAAVRVAYVGTLSERTGERYIMLYTHSQSALVVHNINTTERYVELDVVILLYKGARV